MSFNYLKSYKNSYSRETNCLSLHSLEKTSQLEHQGNENNIVSTKESKMPPFCPMIKVGLISVMSLFPA